MRAGDGEKIKKHGSGNGVCLDRVEKFCYICDILSRGVN